MSLSEAARDVSYIRNVLREIQGGMRRATIIYCDNQSAIRSAEMMCATPKLRHVAIRYHYVRNAVKEGEIELRWVESEKNVADALTKPLTARRFSQHAAALLSPFAAH